MKRRTLPVGVLLGIVALAPGILRAEQVPEAIRNVDRVLDRLGETIETEAESAEVMLAAEKLFRRGLEHYGAGDRATGEGYFQEALHRVERSPNAPRAPSVNRYAHELAAKILAVIRDASFPRPAARAPALLDARWRHPRVARYVRYWESDGRETLRRGLDRLSLYREMMVKTFREYDLPPELIYVALVESLYNPQARSPAGALGLWQFMPETGHRYGLLQKGPGDARTDPVQSTEAAARYWRDLYDRFGDWPLALAAYHAGEGRVLKTMLKTGVRDFWSMAEKRLLPEETVRYVPAVLAVMTVAQSQVPLEFLNRITHLEGK